MAGTGRVIRPHLTPENVMLISDALDDFETSLKKAKLPGSLIARFQRQIMEVKVALLLQKPEVVEEEDGPDVQGSEDS